MQAPIGLIGMWGISKMFFLGCLIHGIRKWRLMLHMEREQHSLYEGPALFFFTWLPKASFWRIRIVYEPLFLIALSIVLPNFFILEPAAANFFLISGIFLAMKNYTGWYMHWQFIRERWTRASQAPSSRPWPKTARPKRISQAFIWRASPRISPPTSAKRRYRISPAFFPQTTKPTKRGNSPWTQRNATFFYSAPRF